MSVQTGYDNLTVAQLHVLLRERYYNIADHPSEGNPPSKPELIQILRTNDILRELSQAKFPVAEAIKLFLSVADYTPYPASNTGVYNYEFAAPGQYQDYPTLFYTYNVIKDRAFMEVIIQEYTVERLLKELEYSQLVAPTDVCGI